MTDQEKQEQAQRERFELLETVARMAGIAARAEEELISIRQELTSSRAASNYWAGEHTKVQTRNRELEARIKELEAPLADLARSLTPE